MADKKINGVAYSVTPLLAKKAIVLQAKLAKVIGPALPALAAAMAGGIGNDSAQKAVLAALKDIAASIDPEQFGNLVEEIVQLAEVNDGGRYRRVIMDQDFTGNLQGVLPVAAFVLQEQFGDFFTALMESGAQGMGAES